MALVFLIPTAEVFYNYKPSDGVIIAFVLGFLLCISPILGREYVAPRHDGQYGQDHGDDE